MGVGITSYYYSIYGISVRSELLLPELGDFNDAAPDAGAAVQLLLGTVPDHLPLGVQAHPQFEHLPDDCIFRVEEIANYRVRGGTEITIQIEDGANDNDVRAFLFGSIFAALLHQRKLLPLHVSAVVAPFGTFAFTGQSGAGKSTLAATVHTLTNWPLFSDDVAVIHPKDDDHLLHAGLVRQKLWTDAIKRLEFQDAYQFKDTTRDDKYHVFDEEMFTLEPSVMTSLFMIEQSDEVSITPINGAEAFSAVTKSLHRPEYVNIFSDREAVLAQCLEIAKNTKVYRYCRPWDPGSLKTSTETLISFLKKDAN